MVCSTHHYPITTQVRQVLMGYAASLSQASEDADAATKQAAKDEDKARVSTGAEEGELDSGGLGGYALATQEANALAAKQVFEYSYYTRTLSPATSRFSRRVLPCAQLSFSTCMWFELMLTGGVWRTTLSFLLNFITRRRRSWHEKTMTCFCVLLTFPLYFLQVSEVTSRLASTFPVEAEEEPAHVDAESVFKAAVAALEAKQGGVVYTAANPGSFNAAKHVPQVTMLHDGGGASSSSAEVKDEEEASSPQGTKQQRCKVSVPHGMAEDHFIAYLWAKDAVSGQMLAGAQLGSDDAPELVFDLPPSDGVKARASVVGYAACNQHGVWQSDVKP